MSDERRFGVRQGRRGLSGIAAAVAAGWRGGDARLRSALGAGGLGGAILAGSALFGLVHVVGGAWHGNPRAMGFGVGLAGVSTALLAGLAALVRRMVDGSRT